MLAHYGDEQSHAQESVRASALLLAGTVGPRLTPQTLRAFELGPLRSAAFAFRHTVPRMSSWSAFAGLKLASRMLTDGRTGLVLCARYPSGFPANVKGPWEKMDVVVDGHVTTHFRFLGGGIRTLRENRPVFTDCGPGVHTVKLVSGISGPNTTVQFDLREGEVVVVDVHPATTTVFGRHGPKVDVRIGIGEQLASSGITPDWGG